jgi:hypothetical protein
MHNGHNVQQQQDPYYEKEKRQEEGGYTIPFIADQKAASERFSIHHLQASKQFNSFHNKEFLLPPAYNNDEEKEKQQEDHQKQLDNEKKEQQQQPDYKISFIADNKTASERFSIHDLKVSQTFNSFQNEELLSGIDEERPEPADDGGQQQHQEEDKQEQREPPCDDQEEDEQDDDILLTPNDLIVAVVKRENQVLDWEEEEPPTEQKQEQPAEEDTTSHQEGIEELNKELEKVKDELAQARRNLVDSSSRRESKRGANMMIKKWKSYARGLKK